MENCYNNVQEKKKKVLQDDPQKISHSWALATREVGHFTISVSHETSAQRGLMSHECFYMNVQTECFYQNLKYDNSPLD